MSILMPALGKAKAQAKAAVCLSNLHQWGIVFMLYADDYDGRFMEGNKGGDEEEPVTWVCVLRPYYGEPEMRVCPTAKRPRVPEPGAPEPAGRTFIAWGVFDGTHWKEAGDYGSYGINSWCYGPDRINYEDQAGLEKWCWGRPSVRGAGYVPLFLDCLWIDGWPQHADSPPPYPDPPPHEAAPNMRRFCMERHNSCIQGVFLDDAARKIGLKELWLLKWHKEFDRNGPWTRAGGVEAEDWPEWMRHIKDY
jgi:hypothetical protein